MISLVLITSQLYLGHHILRRDVTKLLDVVEKGIERSTNQDIWFAGDEMDNLDPDEEYEHSALLGWCRIAARLRMRLQGHRRVQEAAALSRRVAFLEAEVTALKEELTMARAMNPSASRQALDTHGPFSEQADREVADLVHEIHLIKVCRGQGGLGLQGGAQQLFCATPPSLAGTQSRLGDDYSNVPTAASLSMTGYRPRDLMKKVKKPKKGRTAEHRESSLGMPETVRRLQTRRCRS